MKLIWKKLTGYYMYLAEELKRKPSKIKYWYSEFIYFLAITLSKIIRKIELKKLDFEKIKKYCKVYGEEDTLKHFNLSKQALKEILV